MTVPMPPRHIAITGASSGIGEQLARAYAKHGITLSLAARRLEQLEVVAQACRDAGASATATSIDVRNPTELQSWFDKEDAHQPIDLIVINAGIFDGHGANGTYETLAEARQLIEINTSGAINTAQIAMAAMRLRQSGHIAMMSSLAAILPAADAPTYSASKAAIAAYCDAIRMLLAPEGVRVSVILPGHVETAQTDIHVGSLSNILPADQAAAIIKRRLDRGHTHIAFPQISHWLVRMGSLLPWRLKARATQPDRFHVRKPPEGT